MWGTGPPTPLNDVPQGGTFYFMDKIREVKQPTTFDEQINLLRKRGCAVHDEAACRRILSHVGYYHLSAYLLPYKGEDETYMDGTSIEKVYRLYEFDRKLRNILNGAIEVVETDLRTQISFFHAHKYGSMGYLDKNHFTEQHDHEKFLKIISRCLKNNDSLAFVRHHVEQYGGNFPLWVIGELFTFGMWSYFFGDMKTKDKKELTGAWYVEVATWLRCCTDIRNICAHSGRLYYRKFASIPKGLGLNEWNNRSLWGAILAIRALYPIEESWNIEVVPQLSQLFGQYGQIVDLDCLSFPLQWQSMLLKYEPSVFRAR